MSIQNNMNQIIGTLGTAAAATKHLTNQAKEAAETKALKEETAGLKSEQATANRINLIKTDIEAINEAQNTSDRVESLNKEFDTISKESDEAQKAIDSINTEGPRLRESNGRFFAKKAFQEMLDAQEARTDQMERITVQMNLSNQKLTDLNELRDLNNSLLKGGNK